MTRLLPQVHREDFRPCVRNFTPINVWNASVSDSPLKKKIPATLALKEFCFLLLS